MLPVQVNQLTSALLPAGGADALQRHDVRGGGEQRVVHPVLQAARRRGSVPGGGLEALPLRQRQPGQDGRSTGGVMRTAGMARPGPARESGPAPTRHLAAQAGFVQVPAHEKADKYGSNNHLCVVMILFCFY